MNIYTKFAIVALLVAAVYDISARPVISYELCNPAENRPGCTEFCSYFNCGSWIAFNRADAHMVGCVPENREPVSCRAVTHVVMDVPYATAMVA